MFFLRRVLLPQIPSTTTRAPYQLRIRYTQKQNRTVRMFSSQPQTVGKDNEKFVHVETTGYSFLDSNGKRVAKYGIYWGKGDTRNAIRTLSDGSSNVAAMLTAILEVVNMVREEDPPPSLLIYSDLLSCENLLRNLSSWSNREFYSRNHEVKMKNADILHDLHLAVQGLHLKLIYKPTVTPEEPKNRVTAAILEDAIKQWKAKENEKLERIEKRKNTEGKLKYCSTDNPMDLISKIEVEVGTTLDKNGNLVKANSETSPIVYVAARCKNNNGFTSAGYCTHWPGGQIGDKSFRYSPFPVTLFRAELAAVEEALKQAVDADLKSVTVATSSAHFMNGWRRQWIRTTEDHKPFTSKYYYDRIRDLCERLEEVNITYEPEHPQSFISKELEKMCIQGLSYALIGKDKSEYELKLEDIVRPKDFRQEGVPVVRLFKTGTELNAGFVWESDDNKEGVSCCGTPAVLIRILEEAIAQSKDSIVIRADSERLIKSFEAHLEVWHRSGWRNSQHKRIAKSAEWEKAWKLKQKVHVSWEIMRPVEEEDRQQNKRIPVFIST